MKSIIILNSVFIVFLCLILSACGRIEESKNSITHLSYDPTNPNIVWRVRKGSNTAEEFDVINKKVLRTLPQSLKNESLEEIDNQDLEKANAFIPLSDSDKYRSLFYAKEQDNTKPQKFNNRPQQFFDHQSLVQNADYEIFTYKEKEEISDYAEIFIGMIDDTEGFLWKIPLESIIKPRNNITKDNLKNSFKNFRNILYLQLDYKVRYNNFSRRTSEDNISVICAIDKLAGKIIWIYDTYEFSTAKLVEDAQK